MTGISLKIADSDMKIIQVDGGLPVVPQIGNSVGILYPAERIDFILSWPKDSVITDTEIIIDLDKEYVNCQDSTLLNHLNLMVNIKIFPAAKFRPYSNTIFSPLRFSYSISADNEETSK